MRTQKNNRKTQRRSCFVPIEGKKGSIFESIQTLDISKEGLGLLSEKAIPLNHKIAVEIEFSPQGKSVIRIGEVKWIQKLPDSQNYRLGMQLLEEKA